MTHDELIAAMHDLERLREETVELWRIVIDEKGDEVGRLYRGSFQRPRGTEPQHAQEERT